MPSLPLPFLNTRFYDDEGYCSIDFYHRARQHEYVKRFSAAWTELMRHPQMEHWEMVSTPLYLTRCPKCRLSILTNRDHGKELRCRNCGTSHACTPETSDSSVFLLDEIHRALGRQLVDLSGHVQVILVQPSESHGQAAVETLARDAGFAPCGNELLVRHLFMDGFKRGLMDFTLAYTAWQKTCVPNTVGYAGATPPDIERLVRNLRVKLGDVHTGLASYDPTDTSPMGLLLQGRSAEVIAALRSQLAADPTDGDALDALIGMLSAEEEFDEASELAKVATTLEPDNAARWAMLGTIEWRAGRLRPAAEALQTSLELDPANAMGTRTLAECLYELGDEHTAARLFARARALGAPF